MKQIPSALLILLSLGLTASDCWTADYDSYGGWTAIRGKKTGFFHVEKLATRWWLITPEGSAFLSKGVCHISFVGDVSPKLGYSPFERANRAKYGTAEHWAKSTAQQLRGWNFNTVGAWSSEEMTRVSLPYTLILDLGAGSTPDLWLKGGFPDVFSPQFREALDRVAKEKCTSRAKDPWLVGYFTDNELRWGPDWRSRESLLKSFLKMDDNTPGKLKASAFLKERGHDPQSLNQEDEAAFLEVVAREYGSLCREAILRHDPNHLVLGCRFAGYAPESVVRGVGPHFDVISYNNYDHKAPVAKLQKIISLTDKPVMITEFGFKAKDSGLPNSRGGGIPVETQQDRARLFEAYVKELLALPEFLGFHWFEYADEPKEGRFDGEDCNYGLVRIDGMPWEVLTEKMIEINRSLERVAAGH
jgi:hypothetical protein